METLEISKSNDSKFLYISESRFIVMSILTLGIFEIYWNYKNWSYIKKRDNLDIQPVWRAIFGIFYIHSLLSFIEQDNEMNQIEKSAFSASSLATGWVIMILIGNILGKFDDISINTLGILISVSSIICLLPVQKHINRVNNLINPEIPHTGWSFGQVLCLVIGIPLFVLVLIGIFLG
jgi:hypothetical protein